MTENAITLVEWPERAEDALKAERLDIAPRLRARRPGQGPRRHAHRHRRLRAPAPALKAYRQPRRALRLGGCRAPCRCQGDASVIRSYERLVKPTGETALLMISPPRPVGPPVRRGKPYTHHREARRDGSCLRRHGQGPAGARASARPRSTARTWRRACCSSRISAPSPSPTRTGRSRSAMRRRRGFSRRLHGHGPAAGAARGGGHRACRSRPTISKRC